MLGSNVRASWALLIVVAMVAPLHAQRLDETWTVYVNGQFVPVDSDGSFRITNITAADDAPRDFISDEEFRAIGISTANGQTRFASSKPFRIRQGEPCYIGKMSITDTPPEGAVSSISATIDDTTLLAGESAQMEVFGTLIDESERDLTSNSGTKYTSSNLSIATVDQNGIVRPTGSGIVVITATHSSVAAAKAILAGAMTSNFSGRVVDEDGAPVVGARILAFGRLFGSTDINGDFSISNVPVGSEQIRIIAATDTGQGRSGPLDPLVGGTIDVGDITFFPGVIWMVQHGSDELFVVDPFTAATRAVTVVDEVPTILSGMVTTRRVGLREIEWSPDRTVLYATESRSTLYALDGQTGAVLATHNSVGVHGLAFDPDDNLFGSSQTGDLVQIDPETGEVTPIGTMNGSFVWDIEFRDDGQLFGLSGGQLIRIDPVTAQVQETIDLDLPDTFALSLGFDTTGRLLLGAMDGNLYRFDMGTGEVTNIGPVGFRCYGGLTIGPPPANPAQQAPAPSPALNDGLSMVLGDFDSINDGQVIGSSFDSYPWRRFGAATNDQVTVTGQEEKVISGVCSAQYCATWPNRFGAVRRTLDDRTDMTQYVAATVKMRSIETPVPTDTLVKLAMSNGQTTYATFMASPLSGGLQELTFTFNDKEMVRTDGHEKFSDVVRNVTTIGFDFLNRDGSAYTETILFDDFVLWTEEEWLQSHANQPPKTQREMILDLP